MSVPQISIIVLLIHKADSCYYSKQNNKIAFKADIQLSFYRRCLSPPLGGEGKELFSFKWWNCPVHMSQGQIWVQALKYQHFMKWHVPSHLQREIPQMGSSQTLFWPFLPPPGWKAEWFVHHQCAGAPGLSDMLFWNKEEQQHVNPSSLIIRFWLSHAEDSGKFSDSALTFERRFLSIQCQSHLPVGLVSPCTSLENLCRLSGAFSHSHFLLVLRAFKLLQKKKVRSILEKENKIFEAPFWEGCWLNTL